MRCEDCRELLSARIDDELAAEDVRGLEDHLSSCSECAREYRVMSDVHNALSRNHLNYKAPDLLKARIRSAITQAPVVTEQHRPRNQWWRLLAASVAIATVSSLVTFEIARAPGSVPVTNDIVASHVRSLQPGHLTDIVSTNQHNVKPWFNGRVDLSPPVPDLASSGFVLVGGRIDYVGGRTVPVVVYARRQHLINVYSWPTTDESAASPRMTTRNGYHLIEWRQGGMQHWAVSDLNDKELTELVKAFH